MTRQPVSFLSRLKGVLRDFMAQCIGRRLETPPEGEDHGAHQRPSPLRREVVDRAADRFLEAVKSILRGKGDNMFIARRPTVVVVALQRGGEHVKLGERVGHAPVIFRLVFSRRRSATVIGDEGVRPAGTASWRYQLDIGRVFRAPTQRPACHVMDEGPVAFKANAM